MKPFPHTYEAHVEGGPSGYGKLSAAGLPDIRFDTPTDFDGPGDAWSPEHLFLAAVETCYLLTFRGIARASKIDVVSVGVDATGTVDRRDGVTRFTEIVLRPRVVVAAGVDRERIMRIIEKAERNCLVSASLSTPVRLEPEISEPERPMALSA